MNQEQANRIKAVDNYIDWLKFNKRHLPAEINVTRKQYEALLINHNERNHSGTPLMQLNEYKEFRLRIYP